MTFDQKIRNSMGANILFLALFCFWVSAVAQTPKNMDIETAPPVSRTHAVVDPIQSKLKPVESRLLTLVVKQAVNTHPSVHSVQSAQVGTRAEIQAAKYQYFPTPTVDLERSSSANSNALGSAGRNTLSIKQPLWQGGRLDATLSIAQYRHVYAQVSLAETRTRVALATLDAWSAMLNALGRKKSAQNALDRLERLNQMIQRRVQQQVSPQVDASLMVARLNQGKRDVIQAAAAQDAARQRLLQWAGDLLENSGLTLHDQQLLSTLDESFEILPDDFYAELLRNFEQNPSLRRSQTEIAIANAEVQQRRAGLWPNVFARVDRTLGNTGNAGAGQTDRYSDTRYLVGVEFTPGAAGLAAGESVKSSVSKVTSLQSDRDDLKRQLVQNIETGWRQYITNIDSLVLAAATQKDNEELVDSYTRLFVTGRRSWLEVLNAARELSQSEAVMTELKVSQIDQIYRLRIYQGAWEWQNQ